MSSRASYRFLIPLLLAGALTAQAQSGKITRQGRDWIEETTGTLPAAARVQVYSTSGNVEMRGGTDPEITFRVLKRVRAVTEAEARRKLASLRQTSRRTGDSVHLGLEFER